MLQNINLKHLRYFWVVAREGSVARASALIHLTPQTISGQIAKLESQLDCKLFQKSGRNLVLTEVGRATYAYADEIFGLTDQLQKYLDGHNTGQDLVFNVGVAMVVPKLLAYRILAPVTAMDQRVRLVCHEAPFVDLLADLSVNKLDLVLADSPVSPGLKIKAFNHVLGESGISFFARGRQVRHYRADFPQSLDQAPMLMPTRSSALRGALELWFEQHGIRPDVVAEFEDRALMKVFGEAGAGVFTAPTTVEDDVREKYGVKVIGRVSDLREKYFAISTERKITHPATNQITAAARQDLFTHLE